MDFLSPNLPLRRDGPFYALVVAYLCQVHGFNEIASRGVRRQMEQLGDPGIDQMLAAAPDDRTRDALRRIARGGLTGLLAEPGLHSEAGSQLVVDVDALSDAIWEEHKPALAVLNRLSAGSLLVLAWETTDVLHTRAPEWEFLRHCRNAAAHNGSFTFRPHEPRHPAAWRTKTISRNLEGAPLFNDGTRAGFLGPGDTLHLLSDLEAL
jgi:hypothetical protein